jgi:hypothetical protein
MASAQQKLVGEFDVTLRVLGGSVDDYNIKIQHRRID